MSNRGRRRLNTEKTENKHSLRFSSLVAEVCKKEETLYLTAVSDCPQSRANHTFPAQYIQPVKCAVPTTVNHKPHQTSRSDIGEVRPIAEKRLLRHLTKTNM